MDAYTIHKIALYLKDSKIVKQLFYITEYRNLINTSDHHYDQLVLLYTKKDWTIDNLTIIKSFYRLNIPFNYHLCHIDLAALNGNLEIIKWLHENKKSCTKHAMDNAAEKGHLEVVKWLHENRKEGCTKYAMNSAATFGHLEVVKWLHENRKEGCTKTAMDLAAGNGDMEVVKWLHENRKEGCTTDAMDIASENGHLEIVKWLYYNRKEGCTLYSIKGAVRNGHIEIVKWLYTHTHTHENLEGYSKVLSLNKIIDALNNKYIISVNKI